MEKKLLSKGDFLTLYYHSDLSEKIFEFKEVKEN
jgi:hypothetical protein